MLPKIKSFIRSITGAVSAHYLHAFHAYITPHTNYYIFSIIFYDIILHFLIE